SHPHDQWLVARCLKYVLPPVVGTQNVVVARRLMLWLDLSGEKSVNARKTEASESKDGNLSIVPTDCCRLHARRGNGSICRILNDNKCPSKVFGVAGMVRLVGF
ncbi:hypothetical protein AVEN_101602-1, partial [Araneus ventricosus]